MALKAPACIARIAELLAQFARAIAALLSRPSRAAWLRSGIFATSMGCLLCVGMSAVSGPISWIHVSIGPAALLLLIIDVYLSFPRHKLAASISIMLLLLLSFVIWALLCEVGFWFGETPVFLTRPRQVEFTYDTQPQWETRSGNRSPAYGYMYIYSAFAVHLSDLAYGTLGSRPDDHNRISVTGVVSVVRLPYDPPDSSLEGICVKSEGESYSVILASSPEDSRTSNSIELPQDIEAVLGHSREMTSPGQAYAIQLAAEDALFLFLPLAVFGERYYPIGNPPGLHIAYEGDVNLRERDSYRKTYAEVTLGRCVGLESDELSRVSTLQFERTSRLRLPSAYAVLIGSKVQILGEEPLPVESFERVALLVKLENPSIEIAQRAAVSLHWTDPYATSLYLRRDRPSHFPSGSDAAYVLTFHSASGSFLLDGNRYDVSIVDEISVTATDVGFLRTPSSFRISAACHSLSVNGSPLIRDTFWSVIPSVFQTIISGVIISLVAALLALAVKVHGESRLSSRRPK